MNLAHKLSSQLRAAEERSRELEAEANQFRERAATAEKWLVLIHDEVEQTFFQSKNGRNGHSWGSSVRLSDHGLLDELPPSHGPLGSAMMAA
jgi:hypothetical protein